MFPSTDRLVCDRGWWLDDGWREEEAAMRLHQRGVDLLVDLMDAEQHFDKATPDELRRLIHEAVEVFGQMLERDIPVGPDTQLINRPARLP